jgi:hypothetical protein
VVSRGWSRSGKVCGPPWPMLSPQGCPSESTSEQSPHLLSACNAAGSTVTGVAALITKSGIRPKIQKKSAATAESAVMLLDSPGPAERKIQAISAHMRAVQTIITQLIARGLPCNRVSGGSTQWDFGPVSSGSGDSDVGSAFGSSTAISLGSWVVVAAVVAVVVVEEALSAALGAFLVAVSATAAGAASWAWPPLARTSPEISVTPIPQNVGTQSATK